jgi:hypothetical protein
MLSAINEIDMEFKEIKNVNIETIGSLSQITRPCPIKYESVKAQHQQVEDDMFILLSFVLLVVLINCIDLSYGRVTTALSVHGTTVIHSGLLVNDISSS